MKNNGTFGLIDDLSINYNGNRLLKVTDAAEALNYNGALDFHDGADATSEYTYDGNGALTKDSNRGIKDITYDYGHHPDYINMNQGKKSNNITNDYTPDGWKLSSSHRITITNANGIARKTTTNLYIDGLIVRDGVPFMWQFDGGYVDLDANGAATCWNYYVTDHLGSTRMVVDSNNNVKETINYYPFGTEMRMEAPAQMAGDTWQPYRFTSKELDKQNGLNWYDFGARWFDVAGVPMWTSVDPLAEKYYPFTPYAYCAGDPVNKFDPDGKKSYLIIWASDSHHYGHAAFAVDNYKCDSKNGTMAPDGTVTCYSLFPINSYTKKQAIKDEKVRGLFLVSQNVTLEAIKNNEFGSGEDYKPDGILEINSDYSHDSDAKQHMEDEMRSNKGYQGRSRNCSTFAREGVKKATGEDVKGEESSLLLFKYVTPNKLFQDTKKIKDTKTIVDPNGKEKNSFVEY